MARKNVIVSYPMLNNISLGADAESNETDVTYLDGASIHVSWTGSSPVGELIVYAKNGENDTYYALDFGSTIPISGASGEHLIVLSQIHFTTLKLAYDRTSGSGSITAVLTAKTTGA